MFIPPVTWTILFYILSAVIGIQVFYYLYFFRRLAFYTEPEKNDSQEYPVSIIICGRDEAANLAKNLPGVLVQDYKTTHEVIVVNDNSTDDSKYILKEYQRSFKNLNPILLTQEAKMIPGKKFPLSIGIKSSKYEIVLLTDADCVPASEFWLKKMQAAYRPGTEIVLGYGAYKKFSGILNKVIRFETFFSALQYFSYALAGIPYMGVGRNLSYRKEIFYRVKGFSSLNHTPGGDDDLFINKTATRTNTAIVIDKDAHTISMPEKTWSGWRKQKNRHYTTSKYYTRKHKLWLGLFSLTQVMIYPLLALSIIYYSWWIALSVYAARLIIQAIILRKTMQKLNEKDLWPLFLFYDIWLFFYYILFFPSLWKKPKKTWN